MAWTADWPLTSTGGADFTDPAIIGQLVKAFRERQRAVSPSMDWVDLPLEGAEITFYTGGAEDGADWFPEPSWTTASLNLGYIVRFIEYYADRWVRNPSPGAYDGLAAVEMFTLETLREDAGLNAGGFYRCYPHPTTGVSTVAYGPPQDGDYITPRLLNEMRSCLNHMVATQGGGEDIDAYTVAYRFGSAGYSDWATATADAKTSWDANSDGTSNGFPAMARSRGTGGGSSCTAILDRCKRQSFITVFDDDLACDVDWYVLAEAHPGDHSVFYAHGDTVAEGVCKNWLTDNFPANSGVGRGSSVPLGTTATKPNDPWCAEPINYNTFGGWRRKMVGGYTVGPVAVVRYNVAGGFVYVE